MSDLRAYSEEELTALISELASGCIKNQTPEWTEFMLDTCVELMTHLPEMKGSRLTYYARRRLRHERLDNDPKYKVTTHNAWSSAINKLLSKFSKKQLHKQPMDTPHSHDRETCVWTSIIYNPRAPKPSWWIPVVEEETYV